MLGALMFASKLIMEALPNIHLLATFITVYTVAFRAKALYPIYIFVFLTGLYAGFGTWWVPYLYIWTILWGAIMLLPRRMPTAVACVVYSLVSGLFGILYGVLYAPGQALLHGYDLNMTLAWIASGFYFDVVHGISNFALGFLVIPLTNVIKRCTKGI